MVWLRWAVDIWAEAIEIDDCEENLQSYWKIESSDADMKASHLKRG